MIQLRQYIPAFFSGFEPQTAEISSLYELDSVDWIHRWSEDPKFDRFAHDLWPGKCLIAEMKDGKHWVVAFSSESLFSLPLAKFAEDKPGTKDQY